MSVSIGLIILILLLILVAGIVILLVVGFPGGGSKGAVNSNLRALVTAQRNQSSQNLGSKSAEFKTNLAVAAAAESELSRRKSIRSSRLTLEKRLRYARLPITPVQFRAFQLIVTIAVLIPFYARTTFLIWLLVLLLVPLLISGVLDHLVSKKFKAFDKDYPVMLMSFVSLLKTGMSTISGLEAAAAGLDEGSLVRAEIELLIERLRLGLTEEQAISAFGEDVPHPEIELFVQGLLLSRKVGGQLSHTLERLAKQVRKRQQFRMQAVAAVGMERSSTYMIAVIMTLLMIYLSYTASELIVPALTHRWGKYIFQGGIAMIFLGFYWSRRVTNIRV